MNKNCFTYMMGLLVLGVFVFTGSACAAGAAKKGDGNVFPQSLFKDVGGAAQPPAHSEAPGRASAQDMAVGEFSGWKAPVSKGNYYFVKSAIGIFGTRWGTQPQTEQEYEDRTWEQLVLSFEAYRRGISVDQTELDAEIAKMLTADKVTFDRVKDPAAYERWVGDKAKEPVQLFENQLRHLIQLEKLRTQVLNSFTGITVTDQEAFQKFQDEYNTLELELVQFDELNKAKEYYGKMKSPAFWDAQGKKDPKFCRKPGFVSLEFLINMWKIPKDDCYKMMKLDVNTIYPPTPVWKGYGVFRIIRKRAADEKEFPRLKESYLKQVGMIKKYDQLNVWLKDLKRDAGIIVYPVSTGGAN
jgi:hypothetical protein